MSIRAISKIDDISHEQIVPKNAPLKNDSLEFEGGPPTDIEVNKRNILQIFKSIDAEIDEMLKFVNENDSVKKGTAGNIKVIKSNFYYGLTEAMVSGDIGYMSQIINRYRKFLHEIRQNIGFINWRK